MNSEKKTATILEDAKINVKIKLAALWLTVNLLYICGCLFIFQTGDYRGCNSGKSMEISNHSSMVVGSYNINDHSESYGFPVPGIAG